MTGSWGGGAAITISTTSYEYVSATQEISFFTEPTMRNLRQVLNELYRTTTGDHLNPIMKCMFSHCVGKSQLGQDIIRNHAII